MKKKFIKSIVMGFVFMFLFSNLSYAETIINNDGTTTETTVSGICNATNNLGTVGGIINWVSCLLYRSVIPLLFALGTAGFIWGIIQFYLNPDNEEKRNKGKSFIIGGLIALFVMVSMWGIVSIFTNTFNMPNTIPQLPGQQ